MTSQVALATAAQPGTNRRDGAAGASWSFLLPQLRLERILHLGPPSDASLIALARLAASVVIWCPDPRARERLVSLVGERGWAHVEVMAALPPAQPPGERGFDLICLCAGAGHAVTRLRSELDRIPDLLEPGGRAYIELSSWHRRGERLLKGLAARGFADVEPLWLTPHRGEVRAAAPRRAADIRRYVVSGGLHRPEAPSGRLDRLVRKVGGEAARRHPTQRSAVFVKSGGQGDSGIPRFVADLASGSGIDLDGYRWGLSARGRFNSRKVVLLLFAPGGSRPELVVKMTRDPSLNHRLENEHEALTYLDRAGIGDPATRPEVVFFGHHGGLAVLGERAVDGEPFDRLSTASPDCPFALAAVEWLTELAAATLGAEVMCLSPLIEAYERLYRPDDSERRFLAEQVSALESRRVRHVFQHGDSGSWNLLARPPASVTALDWEAASPDGYPLWDLFHFFRSYAVLVARRAGRTDPLDGFARQLLTPSPLHGIVEASLDRYVSRLRLDREVVGPLFVTGFAHRALKEATRLSPDGLAGGHYVRLLRLCISQWQEPSLRWLHPVTGRSVVRRTGGHPAAGSQRRRARSS